jgi:hypothetical protein
MLLLQKNGAAKPIYHKAAMAIVGIALATVIFYMLKLAAEILRASNK